MAHAIRVRQEDILKMAFMHLPSRSLIVRALFQHQRLRRLLRQLAPPPLAITAIVVSLAMSACGDKSAFDPSSSPSLFFPQQRVGDIRADAATALLYGQLIEAEGCLRVNAGDSDTSYLLVWPANYSVSISEETIQIINEFSQVVARVGDEIRVSGGEVRAVEALEGARQLQEEVPIQCSGPFWIVGSEVSVIETPNESNH